MMAKDYFFESEIWLPYPVRTVFDFFKRAENLEQITPPWLNFRILGVSSEKLTQGTMIDYQLTLYGVPFRWRTEIAVWAPPYLFVDAQRRGPYRKWVHTHRFVADNGGTRMSDQVVYQVPGWLLAPLIERHFVRRNVEMIFQYRRERILEIFPGEGQSTDYTD